MSSGFETSHTQTELAEAERRRSASEVAKRAVAAILVGGRCAIRAMADLPATTRSKRCIYGGEPDAVGEVAVVRNDDSLLCDRCAAERAPVLAGVIASVYTKAPARRVKR